MITSAFFCLLLDFGIPLAREAAYNEGVTDEAVKRALFAISLFVGLPLLISLFFILRFIYKNTLAKRRKTTMRQDYRKEAEGYEKAGQFVSAALIYEKHLNDYPKAAELYEKGRDYTQAALLYNHLGNTDRAKEMYEKAGNLEDAAEVAFLEGEFEEAATLYDKAGKKTDVAKVMKQAGKTMYAVKAYREAGEYKKAAMLLQEEGMIKEASEMFGFHLYDKELDSSTIEDFYVYAVMLEKAGDAPKAREVFAKIHKVDPEYEAVGEMFAPLEQAGYREPEEEVPAAKRALRNFILGGRIEPIYSVRLWVHILKSLQNAHRSGWPIGLLSPDNIAIDAQNNISFLRRTQPPAYASPEISKGLEPDERADIYSAGVILFEMLTGGIEGLGSVRASAIADNVPEWLDEIVIKSIKKVREDRYQSIQEIFTDLKMLSKGKTD